MRKTRLKFLLPIILLFVLLPFSVGAFVAKSNDVIKINKDEVIDGNLYAAGTSITIDGTIKGDVICAGQTININGSVEGDIICGGQTININSLVGGNIRVAGNTININNRVGRNLMAFGNNITIGSEADIQWSALTYGAVVNVMGKIGGTLHGGGDNITVDAQIGKNVDYEMTVLNISKNTKIGGDLAYYSSDLDKVVISDQAIIGGKIIKKTKKASLQENTGMILGFSMALLWAKILSIFTMLVIGLVLISLFKDRMKDTVKIMIKKPWTNLGWGLVVLVVTPITAILLAVTIIGLPLALILILSWIIVMILSKVVAAIAIGYWLMNKSKKKTKTLMWPMVLGVIIVCLLFIIPIIGPALVMLAFLWGLGGIWHCLKKYF